MPEHGIRRYRAKTYVHLVWTTWRRLPIITEDRRRVVYRSIANQVGRLTCQTVALGGTEDHVHLLVWFPPSVAISDLVKRAKGASAYCANTVGEDGETFKWQGGYGAFTVSAADVDSVARYVKRRRRHHATGHLSHPLEWVDSDVLTTSRLSRWSEDPH